MFVLCENTSKLSSVVSIMNHTPTMCIYEIITVCTKGHTGGHKKHLGFVARDPKPFNSTMFVAVCSLNAFKDDYKYILPGIFLFLLF